jgi:hypothetical protein
MAIKDLIKKKQAKTAELSKKVTDSEVLVKRVQNLEATNAKLSKERDEHKSALEKFKGEVRTTEIKSKLAAVASAKRAIDPDDIIARFSDKAYFDDATNEVKIRGSEKSLEDEVGDFLKSKPHLQQVEKSNSPGAKPFPAGPEAKVVDMSTSEGATNHIRSLLPGAVKKGY